MAYIHDPYQHNLQCSIDGCFEIKNRNQYLPYFRFPKKMTERMVWVTVTGQDAMWRPRFYNFVCGRHFAQGDFIGRSNTRYAKLRRGARPSLRLPMLDDIEALAAAEAVAAADAAIAQAATAATASTAAAQASAATAQASGGEEGDGAGAGPSTAPTHQPVGEGVAVEEAAAVVGTAEEGVVAPTDLAVGDGTPQEVAEDAPEEGGVVVEGLPEEDSE